MSCVSHTPCKPLLFRAGVVTLLYVSVAAQIASDGRHPFVSAPGVLTASGRTLLTSADKSACEVYSGDAPEVANRLFCLFFTRVGRDGISHGGDILDPYLWPETTYVLSEPVFSLAVDTLRSLLANNVIRNSKPLTRAMLQRDLLAVYDWLLEPALVRNERRNILADLVGQAIDLVALSRREIESLPDTYLESKRDGRVAWPSTASDLVLRNNLYDSQGDWVCVGNAEGIPAARTHAESFRGRSVFHIFVTAPGGRAGVLRFLNELMFRDGLGVVAAPPKEVSPLALAIVRRAVLRDRTGRRTPSPLVESIHVSVLEKERPVAERMARLELSRVQLFRGRGSALQPLGDNDLRHSTFIRHQGDPFERRMAGQQMPAAEAGDPPLQSCGACHEGPGLKSFIAFSRFRFRHSGEPLPRLVATTPAAETALQMGWVTTKVGR